MSPAPVDVDCDLGDGRPAGSGEQLPGAGQFCALVDLAEPGKKHGFE
ncbi:hypothetical protein [Micropruina glycogenica]|nr:hypothetical protein [Micropruina glycogenica]